MMNFTNVTSRPQWGKVYEPFNPMILCRMYQEVTPCSIKVTDILHLTSSHVEIGLQKITH